jgi:hypothetical protein
VRAVRYMTTPGETSIQGVLLQKDAPKELVTPVPLYGMHDGKLIFLGQVFADGAETPFHLKAPPGTHKLMIDPDQTLLARSQ